MFDQETILKLLAIAAAVKLGVGSTFPLVPKRKRKNGTRPPTNWRKAVGTALALAAAIVAGVWVGDPQLGLIGGWIASGTHTLPDALAMIKSGMPGLADATEPVDIAALSDVGEIVDMVEEIAGGNADDVLKQLALRLGRELID